MDELWRQCGQLIREPNLLSDDILVLHIDTHKLASCI